MKDDDNNVNLKRYSVYLTDMRGHSALVRTETTTPFDASRHAISEIYKSHRIEMGVVLIFEGWPKEITDQIRDDKRYQILQNMQVDTIAF